MKVSEIWRPRWWKETHKDIVVTLFLLGDVGGKEEDSVVVLFDGLFVFWRCDIHGLLVLFVYHGLLSFILIYYGPNYEVYYGGWFQLYRQ